MTLRRDPGSFRDPNGFVFWHEGVLLRQINRPYQDDFEFFQSSGLKQELEESGLLIPTHDFQGLPVAEEGYCYLQPEIIEFVSYPFEWSFSQLKDAALLTLEIQSRCIEKGMSLKDSSAYNIQFRAGKPILIDSLSFERFFEGQPWIAYRQFCRHFLAPLALMAFVDVRLSSLLCDYIDGIPLDLASRMLPTLTRLRPGLLMHLHVHSKAESHSAGGDAKSANVSKTGHLALIDSLKSTVQALHWRPEGTEWGGYYQDNNYSKAAMSSKEETVAEALDLLEGPIKSCWDLGANTGQFSRMVSDRGITTVAWDIDPAAVEKNYLETKGNPSPKLLPLRQDLTNPSPAIGWSLQERRSLVDRGPADLVMALALVHHLAIGNNVPLEMVASFFGQIGRSLIVEFVPKSDSQVKRMLSGRQDIFSSYDLEHWKLACEPKFELIKQWRVQDSERTLLLMRAR